MGRVMEPVMESVMMLVMSGHGVNLGVSKLETVMGLIIWSVSTRQEVSGFVHQLS